MLDLACLDQMVAVEQMDSPAFAEALQNPPHVERPRGRSRKYAEDMGDVLWWKLQIEEPPYGSPRTILASSDGTNDAHDGRRW
jgi:hypothetical protein